MDKKRKLTEEEINDILSFITPNPNIPNKTAKQIVCVLREKVIHLLLILNHF